MKHYSLNSQLIAITLSSVAMTSTSILAEDAVPVGEGAVPVGEGAVPVGEGAVPVGEGAVPVGEGAVPVGEGAVPVGEGAVPVGEGAVPVGEGAVPVGEGAVPVGEGAVPVGEGAVPVGEDATPTNLSQARLERLTNRSAAAKAPKTAEMFRGEDPAERITALKGRLAKAVALNSTLSQASLEQRRQQNDQWAQATLASASSRPADLLSLDWWEKHQPVGKPAGYFKTQSSATWWGGSTWPELAKTFALPASTKPFAYVYDKNLTFKHDVIYVNGQPVGSYEDFVASARQLAKSYSSGDSSNPRWIPLGTFAVSTSLKSGKCPHVIQLVTDANGNVAGTYANWVNGTEQSIRGKVDFDTQRVAFDIGGRGNLTLECGLTNLTAEKLRTWAHLPNSHSQTWLMVRMKP